MGQCLASLRGQRHGITAAASPTAALPGTVAEKSPLLRASGKSAPLTAGPRRHPAPGAVLADAPAVPRQRQAALLAHATPDTYRLQAVQAPVSLAADPALQGPAEAEATEATEAAGASQDGQVLHAFSQAVRQRYPQCIASTRSGDRAAIGDPRAARHPAKIYDDVIVKGSDGKVRRFPVDRGTVILVRNGWSDGSLLCLGRAFLQQLGMLYDAHKDAVQASISQYVVDADTQRLVYKTGEKTVRSLRSDIDVFRLPGAKWMVPQTEFRGCTFACERMLLLEGKSAEEATALMKDFDIHDYRRDTSKVAAALRAASQRLPEVLTKTLTSDAWVGLLHQKLVNYGPGILNVDGHARILDAIDTSAEGHVFTMRDPFTGSFLKIRDHEQFWSPASTLDMQEGDTIQATDKLARRHLSAIFLTRAAAPD